MELLLKEEVYAIIGAAIAVHEELGIGFLEAVYHEALMWELRERAIPFESNKELTILYKGRPLTKGYFADLVCYGQIIVELKCVECLTEVHEAQLINYLRATGCRVGLLINFKSPGKLEWKRMVW